MKLFTIDTTRTKECRVMNLTIFSNPRFRRQEKPEQVSSFAELIGFNKTDGYFQETKIPVVKR